MGYGTQFEQGDIPLVAQDTLVGIVIYLANHPLAVLISVVLIILLILLLVKFKK